MNPVGHQGEIDGLVLPEPDVGRELTPAEIEAWLDRLVDGEVREDQRRALLRRLEQTPGGWRRCALAFLESQAWSEACGPHASGEGWQPAVASESSAGISRLGASPGYVGVTEPGLAPQRLIDQPAKNQTRFRTSLAVLSAAASFLVAFGLGVMIQRMWLGDDPPVATSPTGKSGTHTANGRTPGEQPGQWGTVQFVVDGPGGAAEAYQLPAIDGPDPDRWLTQQQPVMPPHILQQLRQAGHHVDMQRHYVPVPLDDGRRVLFPVENIEVRFKGGHGFQ